MGAKLTFNRHSGYPQCMDIHHSHYGYQLLNCWYQRSRYLIRRRCLVSTSTWAWGEPWTGPIFYNICHLICSTRKEYMSSKVNQSRMSTRCNYDNWVVWKTRVRQNFCWYIVPPLWHGADALDALASAFLPGTVLGSPSNKNNVSDWQIIFAQLAYQIWNCQPTFCWLWVFAIFIGEK